jgi:hypothetical protein
MYSAIGSIGVPPQQTECSAKKMWWSPGDYVSDCVWLKGYMICHMAIVFIGLPLTVSLIYPAGKVPLTLF